MAPSGKGSKQSAQPYGAFGLGVVRACRQLGVFSQRRWSRWSAVPQQVNGPRPAAGGKRKPCIRTTSARCLMFVSQKFLFLNVEHMFIAVCIPLYGWTPPFYHAWRDLPRALKTLKVVPLLVGWTPRATGGPSALRMPGDGFVQGIFSIFAL